MRLLFSYYLFLVLALSGCANGGGGAEGGSSAAVTDKALNSLWETTQGNPNGIDLRFALAYLSFNLNTVNVGQCQCVISITGTETAGSAMLSACTHATGTDPTCSNYNLTYTYTKTATALTVCDSVPSCLVYQ